jgi:hypothetical protein
MFHDFKPEIKTFLIVAIVAVGVSVGSILLLRATMPAPSPQPQTFDTAGWQTYRNEEFGFEFQYPQHDFLVKKRTDNIFELHSTEKSNDGVGIAFVVDVSVIEEQEITHWGYSPKWLNEALDLKLLQKRLGQRMKTAFFGDPPRVLYAAWIPLDGSQEGVLFGFDISQIDDPAYGGTYRYRDIANQILSTFRFTP